VGKDPAHVLGGHFYQISRAALSLQPVLEKPSIVTIQTLYIMSTYNGNDMKGDTSMEMTWSLITLASNLSQKVRCSFPNFFLAFLTSILRLDSVRYSIAYCLLHLMSCLDRDSAHWGLSPKMTQRRRILFWELFVSDVWQVCLFFPILYFCLTNKIRV